MRRPASEWGGAYPGDRPEMSYVQLDYYVIDIEYGVESLVNGMPLDDWLEQKYTVPLAHRTPLLSYGSNACPSKLVDLRERCGLTGPVIMTACTVEGFGAAWCKGTRRIDDAVPATLAPAPGTERHFLWWVADDQWEAIDTCEGCPTWYDRVTVDAPVHDELGQRVDDVRAYVGVHPERRARTDDAGLPILVRDVPQAQIRDHVACGSLPPPWITAKR